MSEKITDRKMTRKEFLKMTGLGALGLIIASKFDIGSVNADAATVSVPIDDNLGDVVKSSQPPEDKTKMWYNTNSTTVGHVYPGVVARWDSTYGWIPIVATWN